MMNIVALISYILGLSLIWVLNDVPDGLLLRQRMILLMTTQQILINLIYSAKVSLTLQVLFIALVEIQEIRMDY